MAHDERAVRALREQRGYTPTDDDDVRVFMPERRILCIARTSRPPAGVDGGLRMALWDDAAGGWRVTAWLPPDDLNAPQRAIYARLRADGMPHDRAAEAARLLG